MNAQRHKVAKSLDVDSSWRFAQEQSANDDQRLSVCN
jgi:hypothetical protein